MLIKKLFALAILILPVQLMLAQDTYVAGGTSNIALYSDAPIEDISAKATSISGAVNIATKAVYFKVKITSFHFANPKMEEHFNENYMESAKFPDATFKGNITDTVDLKKDGQYNVNITGTLTVHGVEKVRTIPGTITVKDGKIWMYSKFQVACADHNITIPQAVTNNIASSIDVTAGFEMSPYVK